MEELLDSKEWANYFNQFNQRNQSRPTRLEVFGENGAQQPERGLPFKGISLAQLDGKSNAEIMLGDLIVNGPRFRMVSRFRGENFLGCSKCKIRTICFHGCCSRKRRRS